MDTDKALQVLSFIQYDMENDVKELEGKPFTGKVVSTASGHQAAAISALARILEHVLKEDIK